MGLGPLGEGPRYTTTDCKKTKELSDKRASFPVENHDYMWVLVGED